MSVHQSSSASSIPSFSNSSSKGYDPLISKHPPSITLSPRTPRPSVPITLSFEEYIESLATQLEPQLEQVSNERSSSSPPSEPRTRRRQFRVHEFLQPVNIASENTSNKSSMRETSIPRPKKRPDSYPGRIISGNATYEPDIAPKERWYPNTTPKQPSSPVESPPPVPVVEIPPVSVTRKLRSPAIKLSSTPGAKTLVEENGVSSAAMSSSDQEAASDKGRQSIYVGQETSDTLENGLHQSRFASMHSLNTTPRNSASGVLPKLPASGTRLSSNPDFAILMSDSLGTRISKDSISPRARVAPGLDSANQPLYSSQRPSQIPQRKVSAVSTRHYTNPALRRDQDSSADEASLTYVASLQEPQSSSSSIIPKSQQTPESSSVSPLTQYISSNQDAGPSQSSSDFQSSYDLVKKPSKRTRRTQNRRRREAEMEAAKTSLITDTESDAVPQHKHGQVSPFGDPTNREESPSPAEIEKKFNKARRLRINQSNRKAQAVAANGATAASSEIESEADGTQSEYTDAEDPSAADPEPEATRSAPEDPDSISGHERASATGQQEALASDGAERMASTEDAASQQARNEARLINEQRKKCESEKEALREELEQQQRHRCEDEKAALKLSLEEKAAAEHRHCEEEKRALKQEIELKAAEERRHGEEVNLTLKETLEIKVAEDRTALIESLEKIAAEDRQRWEEEERQRHETEKLALITELEANVAEERLMSQRAIKLASKAEADARKELGALIEGKEREYQAAKQFGKELGDRFTREKNEYYAQIMLLNEKFESSMKEIESLESQKERSDRDIASANTELVSKNEEVDRLKKELDTITTESEKETKHSAELEGRYNDTTTDLREIRRQLQECEAHRRDVALTSELMQQELDRAKAEMSALVDQKKENDTLQQAYDERAVEHEGLLVQLEILERENRNLYRSLRDPAAVVNTQSITSAAADLHESLDRELEDVNSDSDEAESAQASDSRIVHFAESKKKSAKDSTIYKAASKSAKNTLSEAVQRDLEHHRAQIESQEKQILIEEESPFGPADEKRIRKHISSTPKLVFRDNHDYVETSNFFQLDDANLQFQKDHIEQTFDRQMQILGKIFALGRRLAMSEGSKPTNAEGFVDRNKVVLVPSIERNALKWWLQPYIDLREYSKVWTAKKDLARHKSQKSAKFEDTESDIKKQEQLLPPVWDVLNLLMIHLALYVLVVFLLYSSFSVRKEAQIWKAANKLTQEYLTVLRAQSSSCCVDRPALIWQMLPEGMPDWMAGLWFDFTRHLNVERSLVG